MQVYVLVFGSECQVRTYVRAFVRRSSAPSTEEEILPVNPFESLDTKGVGRLMTIAVDEGRKAREDLEVGICGEHGGDPASIHFCHQLGLNYVSCSPYRVPVARLAAAQAAIETKERDR